MKNLLTNFESSEELPSHARMRELDNPTKGFYPCRNRHDYPWKRVWRFLMSNVGEHWDNVYSKYCKLEWIPNRHKNLKQISYNVILNTFLKEGKVYYYENCRYSRVDSDFTNERSIEDHYRECFYIHPKTKLLCFKQAKKQSDNESNKNETIHILGPYHQLLKMSGVWHEIKGEPKSNENIIEINGLHYELLNNVKPVKKFYVHGGIFVDEFNIPVPYQYKNHKIINGKVYIPYTQYKYSNWDSQYLIGPNDRMIEDYSNYEKHSYWNRKNYGSVKITLRRQLNSKDLRKHGLKNDKEATGPICPKCGGIKGKHCFHDLKENNL